MVGDNLFAANDTTRHVVAVPAMGRFICDLIGTGNIGPNQVILPTSLESFYPEAEAISGHADEYSNKRQGLIISVPPLPLFQRRRLPSKTMESGVNFRNHQNMAD
jgi:hypothetical protein